MKYNRKRLVNGKAALLQMDRTARKVFAVSGYHPTPEQQKELFVLLYDRFNRRGKEKLYTYMLDIMPLKKYTATISNKGIEKNVFRAIRQKNHKTLEKVKGIQAKYNL
jgi:hypothetical protein